METLDIFREIFEPGLIKELHAKSKFITVKAGDVILDIGETVRQIPIILKGSVKVSRIDDDGKELLLYYVNPKESCAMTFTCCMQQHPSEIKAVAEEEVEILTVPIGVMDQWLVKYPSWKSFVMKTIQ